MQAFFKNFKQDSMGSWVCIAPATLELAGGRIQVTVGSCFARGTTFMNADLAKILDEYAELQRPRAGA
jgi:hypothetical protein